jgi:flagellar L-ring protein precursor FlgH
MFRFKRTNKIDIIAISFVWTIALSVGVCAQKQGENKEESKSDKQSRQNAAPQTMQTETQPNGQESSQQQQRPANGSLFTDEGFGNNLLSDFKSRKVGDLVFVDVVEASEATVTSSAKRSRDSGTVGGLGTLVGSLPVSGASTAGSVIGALGTRKFEGKGQTGRTSEVRARIVARVVEVLPNGDLRIVAEKQVKINKETEKLLLCGIVRQRDIAADNSIPTTFVGDLRVELNGKGVASADNQPGWLFRLFDKISPF